MTIRLLRQIWQNKDSNQNNHSWISGTRFEQFHNIVLYDFAIHWFDTVRYAFGEREAKQVFSQVEHLRGQELKPPLSAQNIIQFDGGLASLVFHAHTMFSPAESITVTGTKGTFRSSGPVCRNEDITLTIEEDREPSNSVSHNLKSLELCFAAVASADKGDPVRPGDLQTVKY